MPLFGITTTQLKAGARFLLREAGYVMPFALDALSADVEDKPNTSNPEWRRWVTTAARTTPTGTIEDLAQFKIDLLNVTAGDIDTTWTSGDYAAVKTAFDTYLTTLQPLTGSAFTFNGYKAYRMKFNPVPDLERPFLDTGPPAYTAAISKVGTGSGTLPYQVSTTVTLQTGLPRHWGRFYLPGPYTSALPATTGRWTSAYVSAVANASRTLANSLIDAGFWPVVPMGQFQKSPMHALLGVSTMQVDDVPDIQRRRRARMPSIRTIV